jgi:hypothetical protein
MLDIDSTIYYWGYSICSYVQLWSVCWSDKLIVYFVTFARNKSRQRSKYTHLPIDLKRAKEKSLIWTINTKAMKTISISNSLWWKKEKDHKNVCSKRIKIVTVWSMMIALFHLLQNWMHCFILGWTRWWGQYGIRWPTGGSWYTRSTWRTSQFLFLFSIT